MLLHIIALGTLIFIRLFVFATMKTLQILLKALADQITIFLFLRIRIIRHSNVLGYSNFLGNSLVWPYTCDGVDSW